MPLSNQNTLLFSIALLALSIMLSASSCSKEDQLANQIERNTPTELPPISQTGANTMGAYVTVAGERHLFVASGVERGGSVGTISADCAPFNNFLYQTRGDIVIHGIWCTRPEIERPIHMDLALSIPTISDSLGLNFSIDYDGLLGNRGTTYINRNKTLGVDVDILHHDSQEQIIAASFSGYSVNINNPFDTAFITDGRFDVRYGLTQ